MILPRAEAYFLQHVLSLNTFNAVVTVTRQMHLNSLYNVLKGYEMSLDNFSGDVPITTAFPDKEIYLVSWAKYMVAIYVFIAALTTCMVFLVCLLCNS